MKKILLSMFFLFFKQFTGLSQTYVLYGVTYSGVLFCYEPNTSRFIVLVNSTELAGEMGGNLIQDTTSGYIYGMSSIEGDFANGLIFRYDPNTNIDTSIYSFHTPTGILPFGSPMLASNGLLYGMTSYFNIYHGIFFSFDPKTFIYTDIFSFDTTNGAAPLLCQPVQATDGMIYGMTPLGGSKNMGVLFRYNPVNNQDTVVLNFDSINGWGPDGSVIQASNGLLYGMIGGGGEYNYGVFFHITQ